MYSLRRIQLLVLLWAFATIAVAMTPSVGQAARTTAGLQVLYGFAEGSGTTVQDVSGVGSPLDLTISNSGAVSWLSGGGLDVNSSVTISSAGTATKIYSALQASNAMTVEAWLVPDNTDQFGPARIVTLSPDPNSANFSLGQGANGMPNDVYGMRLRTTASDVHGLPSLPTPAGSLTTSLTHVVFTRNAGGDRAMYLNGSPVASDNFTGDFSSWSGGDPLTLANVPTGDRPWLGQFHLAAIYDRALTPSEVSDNFAFGPDLGGSPPVGPMVCEDFESGFTIGQPVGDNANWFDLGNGPVVTSGIGVGGSNGLAPGSSITTWTGEPFDFTDPDFYGVTFQMDFQTSSTGTFDDDRIGWMIADDNVSSNNIFGVQLDPGVSDLNIECYWDGDTVGDDGGRTSIADLPALTPDTYYRLRATIIKLTATSVQIDAALYNVDGLGNTGTVVASGSIPDTDLLPNTEGEEIPNSAYFTGPIWPALKNHTGADGAVDNFCYELIDAPVTAVRFAAFGDYGDEGPNELAVSNLVHSFNPDFCVLTGDNSYDATDIDLNIGQYFSDFIGNYQGSFGPGSPVNRFFPALGNHDYTDGGGFNAYRAYFDLPGAGIDGSDPSGEERYYEFVQGPVHFFVIDSNPAGIGSPPAPGDGRSATSVQALWLQAQLAASTSPWKIVYMHHPPFSSSSNHGSEVEMQWPYEAWGATAVLAGHDHVYERILHDDNSNGVDFPYFTTGAGARSLYNFGTPLPGSAVRYNNDYGTMIIDATETNLTFEFHSINPNDGVGGLIDSYTIGDPSSTFNLTTNTVGGGSIELDPLGGVYEAGTPVTVTAVPDQDWTFLQWSGSLSGSNNPETIIMNGNRSVTAIFTNGEEIVVCDDLESGYTLGQELRTHPDWFYEDASSGPFPEAGIGVAGSIGLTTGNKNFAWVAHPFDWNDPTLTGVWFEMDFQASPTGVFDDDRIGWTISDTDDSSDLIFGVQMDPGGSGAGGNIEAYWDGATFGDNDGRSSIVDLPALTGNGWYRFHVDITKLTPTSARLDVTLTELDGSGNEGAVVASGSLVDTDALPNTAGEAIPNLGYFTAATMWPVYKNHTAADGAVDNPCFGIYGGTPIEYTLTATSVGNGTVTLDPPGGVYNGGQTVTVTAVPDPDWAFAGWNGDLSGCGNPEMITMDGDKAVEATFFQTAAGTNSEDFESGFTLDVNVGEHPDWFDGDTDTGSNVTAGIGLGGSIGLAPGATIATWTAHPFSWNDPTFRSVTLRMDFQTDAAGQFDDDRVCYMIADDDNSSTHAFGAQLDQIDGGIVTYWRDASDARIQDQIVALPALGADTWYRFTTKITKVLAGSARLDVTLVELDAGGNPVGVPVIGVVPNTSTWAGGAPNDKYFTACAMWPGYKNHTAVDGAADNAGATFTFGPPTQHSVTISVVGNGSVTTDPDQPTYDLGSVVELTAIPDPGWEFSAWSGDLTGSSNPENLTVTGNMNVTVTFTEQGPLAAGDLIISSIQSWNTPTGQDPGEFVEIFNTTGQTIALDGMEIISRTDNNSDGVVDIDWQLAADLTGLEIAPYSFFLVAEAGVNGENGVRDLETDMDLATGEGGVDERAISVQLMVDGVHMDYVVYGRHDGTDPAGELPPGDRAFDGSSYPRTEVIRNTLGTASYQEGVLRRLDAEDLYAGYDVEGFYTDEGSLAGSFPDGVWYSPHDNTFGSYVVRNSTSTPVPPGGNEAPDAPVLVSPLDDAENVNANPELRVTVTDSDLDAMDVTFFGREVEVGGGGDPFTIIPLPDTQKYSENYPANYMAQTQWVVDNILARNIVYLAHEGDMVEHAGTESEWLVADGAMSLLEDPVTTGMPEGLPYGVLPGNHDQPTGLYNTYFGTARFSGRGYYGGNYLSDNDNNYTLFSAGGMDFIAVNLEYNPSSGAIAWADNLFQTFSDRRGIVVSHYMMETNGAWSGAGSSIYEAVKDNPNVFLMLCGHKHGEAVRTDTFNGNVIHSVLADYQDLPNGGNGWLRIMEFRPADNQIYVQTYSPVVDEFGTDVVRGDDTTSEDFTLNYEMGGSRAAYTNLGTASGVASGNDAELTWSGLANLTEYEWFVEISDGVAVTTGPTWSFITGDVSGVAENLVPSRLEAPGNYPNPFNPMTRLRFALPSSGHVEVTVYDVKGRAVRNLVNRDYPQGRHEVVWDGRDDSGQVLSSGTYLYQVKAGGSVVSGKMVLMK